MTIYWLAVRFYSNGPVKRLEFYSMTEQQMAFLALDAQHVEIIGEGIGE